MKFLYIFLILIISLGCIEELDDKNISCTDSKIDCPQNYYCLDETDDDKNNKVCHECNFCSDGEKCIVESSRVACCDRSEDNFVDNPEICYFPCREDEDCNDQEFCNEQNRCEPEVINCNMPNSLANCPTGKFCAEPGYCIDIEFCRDNNCDRGWYCELMFCDNSTGLDCQGYDGVCIPNYELCGGDYGECDEPHLSCIDGVCIDETVIDCNPLCDAEIGEMCEMGVCIGGFCDQQNMCKYPSRCTGNDVTGGTCQIEWCDTDGECGEGHRCQYTSKGDFCMPSCGNNEECPRGSECIENFCQGFDIVEGCQNDGDCNLGIIDPAEWEEECRDGACYHKCANISNCIHIGEQVDKCIENICIYSECNTNLGCSGNLECQTVNIKSNDTNFGEANYCLDPSCETETFECPFLCYKYMVDENGCLECVCDEMPAE